MKTLLAALLVSLAVSPSLQAAETVTIVAEDDFYPYSHGAGGKPEGFAVDIVRAAYKAVGVDVDLKVMPYQRGMDETKDGKQVGVFDTAKQPRYDADYVFHDTPLAQQTLMIWAPAASTATGLKEEDLKGKSVGITQGYDYTASFDGSTVIRKQEAPSDQTMLRKLALGRTDYAICDEKVAQSVSGSDPSLKGKVKPVGSIGGSGLFIAFSRKHPEGAKWAARLEEGLKTIHADGSYERIEADWSKKLAGS